MQKLLQFICKKNDISLEMIRQSRDARELGTPSEFYFYGRKKIVVIYFSALQIVAINLEKNDISLKAIQLSRGVNFTYVSD